MLSRNLTAVALVLSLGATPLAAQTDSGDAGGADGAGEAGAAADSGAAGGTEGSQSGAAAEGDAGATAGSGVDGETGASAEADQSGESDATGADDATGQAEAAGEAGTAADAAAAPGNEAAGEIGGTGELGTVADPHRETPPNLEALTDEENVARFEVGTLTCDLEGWTNAIIYAEESFDCVFADEDGRTIAYDGKISKLGANLQIKGDQTLEWVVLSSITADEAHDLSGTYLGASAQASLGIGAGANVLIGGSGDNFTLQPISVTGQEGFGASLTIDTLNLSRAY